ncbi:hypothetical protein [Aeromonas sp. Y311-2]|uniref:hypothetical protein n=1 Tax=Aeromonas sp. Y311-2 TaxID=2990507 RepID=UPI0022E46EF1|nr:hypothetical protein [Aeromonas sp. Y311-2]
MFDVTTRGVLVSSGKIVPIADLGLYASCDPVMGANFVKTTGKIVQPNIDSINSELFVQIDGNKLIRALNNIYPEWPILLAQALDEKLSINR